MPEVIFPGPEGRLEGRFSPGPRPRAPVALILHPHPQGGGTMNNAIVLALYKTFVRRGFATLRFNFRGVGKSQSVFDNGIGELSDAASALDWVQSIHPEAETTWVAGVSFGAWIGMQLLMRRPEIRGCGTSRVSCIVRKNVASWRYPRCGGPSNSRRKSR